MDTRKTGFSAIVFLGLLALTEQGLAQSWVATTAPSQAWTAVAVSTNGQRMVATSSSGTVYVSASGGAKWTAANVPHQAWTSLAASADGTRLVAAASHGSICMSEDSGASWETVSGSSNAWFGAAGSSDGSRMFAVASESGIFRSQDAGTNWTAALTTNEQWSCVACSADGRTVVAAADPGPIYTSTDAGLTWQASVTSNLVIGETNWVSTNNSWIAVASSADGSLLAAAAVLDGIYVSTDSGASWSRTSAPTNAWSGLACSSDGTKLVATEFDGGVFTSADSGQTWVESDADFLGWSAVACSGAGSNLVAAVFNGGIYVPGAPGARTGSYQGLFFDTNNPALESSGFFSATIDKKGKLAGKLSLAGKSYPFSGQFSEGGLLSNTISRSKAAPMTVQLQPALSGNALKGFVSNGSWTAQLMANRYAFSKTNRAGLTITNYTLVMASNSLATATNSVVTNSVATNGAAGAQSTFGFLSSTSTPCIFGFGTVAADASGNLSFRGALGDGTAAAEKTFVSTRGSWPLYVSQSAGKGVALGWLSFTNGTNIGGSVTWVRPASAKNHLYPGGFTNQTPVTGSRFQSSDTATIFGSATNCQVQLANGNLPPFTNSAGLVFGSAVIGSNGLSLNINASTGAFKGRMLNPETHKSMPLNGVLLTGLGLGVGEFLGADQTGGLLLVPGD